MDKDSLSFEGVLPSLQRMLKENLLPNHPIRYFHSFLVYDIALGLQSFYPSISIGDLSIATLSHDLCKYISIDETKKLCHQWGESFPPDLESFTECLHGFTASLILKYELFVSDVHILSAIRYHTTGKPELDLLGLLVYVSDFLASLFSRNNPKEFLTLYHLSTQNIKKAAYHCCQATLEYLKESHKAIHPLSLDFRNWLLQELNQTP